MFVTAVRDLYLTKVRFPKKKSISSVWFRNGLAVCMTFPICTIIIPQKPCCLGNVMQGNKKYSGAIDVFPCNKWSEVGVMSGMVDHGPCHFTLQISMIRIAPRKKLN